ncbi:hypothetical protein TRM7557_02160 [Tritonibacter multivorans]|uniref:META domain protein n=2 Tax=Tritonibacter multivorans TaxID=928856 RepID=A0A0P1GCC0_9RHOB|nr:hypothetical protein TRM7557_02160 [Tritonibacter multivorans]SFD26188.1 hypothetical protein SAMN04488049_11025 [Tritonibacter multivorans]
MGRFLKRATRTTKIDLRFCISLHRGMQCKYLNRGAAYLALVLIATLTQGCLRTETVAAYGAAAGIWDLEQILGPNQTANENTVLPARLNLQFSGPTQVQANTRCLSLTARNTAPYPWFRLEQTRMSRPSGCVASRDDASTMALLQSRTEVEVSGPFLILRAQDRTEMVFTQEIRGDAQ